MRRIQKVLAAVKLSEMVELGANRTAAAAARARASTLRTDSRGAQPGGAPGDMQAVGLWQRHAEALARDMDAKARALDTEAEPMKAALARTLGREEVITGLIEKARLEAQRIAERRAEG